jgi:hypothetical protein
MPGQPISTRPYRLMITGSRRATPAMLATARKAVQRAKALGYAILVGDAPGVDAAVVAECNRLGLTYACVCVAGKGRNREARLVVNAPVRSYTQRDRWMVARADRVLAIHNGRSPGTLAAYRFAIAQNKPADRLQP